ncbi:hypothetical protein JCM10212_003483 [Sporobolomyces blumeae]
MSTPRSSPLVLGPILPGDWPTSRTDPSYEGYSRAIVDAASTLLESIHASVESGQGPWTKGKSFHDSTFPTQTYSSTSHPAPGAGDTQHLKWHVRQSRHAPGGEPSVAYDEFRFGLFEHHSEHEKEYIDDCTRAEQVEAIKPGEMEIWKMLYHQPFPATNRSFTFLIATVEPNPSAPPGSRSFIVVSIPVAHPDAPPEKGYVRGRYVSVEECKEQGQEVVWTMAVSSDPGGMVPNFLSEKVMPSKISEDVPSFLNWIKDQNVPRRTSSTAQTVGSTDPSSTTTTATTTGDAAPSLPPLQDSGAL